MKTYAVLKSIPTRDGGYVNTIERISIMKVFGVNKTTRFRHYLKSDKALDVGADIAIEISEYNIVQRISELEQNMITGLVTNERIHTGGRLAPTWLVRINP